jgi:hypothetical protein
MNFPQPNNGNIPLIGQQQAAVLNAAVLITPELLLKLESWSKRTGIPFNELGQTIFRMGLIGLSLNIDMPPLTAEDVSKCIPITENEKKIRFN